MGTIASNQTNKQTTNKQNKTSFGTRKSNETEYIQDIDDINENNDDNGSHNPCTCICHSLKILVPNHYYHSFSYNYMKNVFYIIIFICPSLLCISCMDPAWVRILQVPNNSQYHSFNCHCPRAISPFTIPSSIKWADHYTLIVFVVLSGSAIINSQANLPCRRACGFVCSHRPTDGDAFNLKFECIEMKFADDIGYSISFIDVSLWCACNVTWILHEAWIIFSFDSDIGSHCTCLWSCAYVFGVFRGICVCWIIHHAAVFCVLVWAKYDVYMRCYPIIAMLCFRYCSDITQSSTYKRNFHLFKADLFWKSKNRAPWLGHEPAGQWFNTHVRWMWRYLMVPLSSPSRNIDYMMQRNIQGTLFPSWLEHISAHSRRSWIQYPSWCPQCCEDYHASMLSKHQYSVFFLRCPLNFFNSTF